MKTALSFLFGLTLATSAHAQTPLTPAKDANQDRTEASAAETPAAEAEDDEVIDVVVTGHAADSLQKVPGSMSRLSPKEVRRVAPADTGELLRRVPGVHVRPEEGAGLRLNIGMRGLSPTRSKLVQVLEDGIPIALNPYGEPDLYYSTPVDRIHAVEVIKGSGSLLYGPRVVGGVVNFVTVAPPWKKTWVVEGHAGQRGYYQALGRYGDKVGDTRYVLQAVHRQGDGVRDIDFSTQDVLGKIAFATSDSGEATVKIGIYDEWSRAPYLGLTQLMYDQDPRQPSLSRFVGFQVRRYDASLKHEQWFGVRTRLTTMVYAYETQRAWRRQDYDRQRDPTEAYQRVEGDPSIEDGAVFFRNTATIRDRNYDVVGIEPRLEHRFDTAGIRHTLQVGARVLGETGRQRQYRTDAPSSDAGDQIADESNRTIALAAYLQDRLAFREDLLVTPGVRVEHGQQRRTIRRRAVGGVPQDVFVQGDSDFTSVMPGIGMTAGKSAAHFFGGVHAGFAPPRVSQAVTSGGLSAELKAERSVHYELGGRLRPVGSVHLESTAFLMNFYNQIVFGTPAAGAQSELINGGSTRHAGVETATRLQLADALGWRGEADLVARHTYVRAMFRGGAFDGNTLPYAPEHTALVGADVRHQSGPFAGGSWTYVAEQYADEANTGEPDTTGRVGELPDYHVLDLRAGYHHAVFGLTADVTVKSALDQVYIASRLPDGIHTAGFRQVTLGLRWEQ